MGAIRSIETLHARLRYRVTPVFQVLTKRLISNIYIKVHWHGTTGKPKVRNGAGIFKYKSTQQYPLHLMIEMTFILALLYITAIQDGPSRVLRTLPINLMMARLFSGEDKSERAYWLIPSSSVLNVFFTSLMYREVIRASKEAEKPV